MVTMARRWWGRLRAASIRFRSFGRRPRTTTGRLPNLTPQQQAVYDRACRFLRETYIPVTGEKERW